ncbi:hypothetical protein [Phenylobacterium sp.]|uniref:hypothetical protein n=1 Tax=Phenylobacterium sp. TaxID=1871053 RepID=UPI00286B986B|nr:hypothetical protein [Phenylobacterium sp.]
MIMTSMRVFPSLFVGRREVITALESPHIFGEGEPGTSFACGACEEVVMTSRDRSDIADVVVKCRCGEYNQL